MKNEESEKKNLLTNQSSASENEEDDEEEANEIKEITSPKPSKELDTASLKLTAPVQLKVYPQRWLMLAIFSLTTLLNGSMFMGLSAVVEVASPYYEVSAVNIELLSNMYMIVFIFVSMPSAYAMSKYGVRAILSLAAGLDALGTLIQYFGSKRDAYMYVVIGQFLAGRRLRQYVIRPWKAVSYLVPVSRKRHVDFYRSLYEYPWSSSWICTTFLHDPCIK